MNIWKQPYPKNILDIVEKSNALTIELEQKLNDPKCKRLDDLYFLDKKGRLKRNVKAFEELSYLPNSRLNDKSKKDDELKGIYVFGKETSNKKVAIKYIGISRTIYRGLKQHGWGKLHNEATLASLKAIRKKIHTGLRETMKLEIIQEQQKKNKRL